MADRTGFNIQDIFLNQIRKDKIPVTVVVVNGYQLKGALIKGFDNFVILSEIDGKQTMIYKHAISSIIPEKPVVLPSAE